MQRLAIVGTGGLARETQWIAREINLAGRCAGEATTSGKVYDVVAFISSKPQEYGTTIGLVPVCGPDEWFQDNPDVLAICAIGNPRVRVRVVTRLESWAVSFATLVHPAVKASDDVEIGPGSIVFPGTVLTTQVIVGRHCLLNPNCTVSHDSVIDDFASIGPGASIPGGVRIGYAAEIETNASLLPGVSLGRGSVLGAGAVAIRDIADNVVAAGVPAKPIGSKEPL